MRSSRKEDILRALQPFLSPQQYEEFAALLAQSPAQDDPPDFPGKPIPGGKMVPLDAVVRAINDLAEAKADTREVLPAQDALALDSAAGVYRAACRRMGVDVAGIHDAKSLQIVFRTHRQQRRTNGRSLMAMDADAAEDFETRFPNAARVGILG